MRCGTEPILIAELTTPTSKRGLAVVGQYETTLKELLNDSPWNFTIKKKKITVQSSAINSWSFVGTAITLVVGVGHGFVANDVVVVAGLLADSFAPNTGGATGADGVAINSVTATTIVYTAENAPTGTPTVNVATAFVKAGSLFGYRYRYALPADTIRILELDFKQPYRVESTGILCDTDGFILVKYCFFNDTPATYSGAFVKAFALKLAEDISYLMVQSAALQGAITTEAERYLRKARSMNSQEGTPETRYPEEYTAGIRR